MREKKCKFTFFPPYLDISPGTISTEQKRHATAFFAILAVPYNANLDIFRMFASHECGTHYALARRAICLPNPVVGQLCCH